MKIRSCTTWQGPRRRWGFTLIELLVVVAIIAVLVSLTAAGIFKVVDGTKQSNTEQTLRTLSKALRQQWERVIKDHRDDAIPANVLSMAGGAGNESRARVIWIKLCLKQEFPTTYQEAQTPYLNNDGTVNAYITATDLPGLYTTPASGGAEQSSVCLWMSLSRARSGVKFNPDDLGSNALASGPTTSYKEFVDGWGNPLLFYRWPINEVFSGELTTTNPAPNASFPDPLDPEGTLLDPNWQASQGGQAFLQIGHTLGSPYPSYFVPVIASAGRDLVPGDSDDIYSFRLREGAKGD
jgi:prepilin-type N-terminal cleavage/methylation domain-containing protein